MRWIEEKEERGIVQRIAEAHIAKCASLKLTRGAYWLNAPRIVVGTTQITRGSDIVTKHSLAHWLASYAVPLATQVRLLVGPIFLFFFVKARFSVKTLSKQI